MLFRSAAALFLTIGSLSRDALAELITITQYPSTCSAIYTTGTRSVTIVQSTVTVVPVPYDDAAWNSGTPFVLEIEMDSPTKPLASRADLASRSWVRLNGNTSTNPLSAGQYYIRNGQLMSVNGSYLSTDLNVQNQPFAISNTPGSISTAFTFRDGVLNWTSPRFTGGRAKFCKLPAGQFDNAQVLAQFIGPIYAAQTCAPIRFLARPCSEVNPLSSTSSIVTATGSVSSSIPGQSAPSGPSVTYNPPPYTYQPMSSSSSNAPVPSVSTPPPPYIDSTSSPVASSSSSSHSLPSLSSPAVYTSASAPSSFPSLTPYTRTSSSPMDGISSSTNQPPIYGSLTPSLSLPSSSSTSSLIFASSGSIIGPDKPPIYGSTSSSSSSISSSMSISSGGVKSSESSSASSSLSSLSLPPIYTAPSASNSASTTSPSSSVSTTLPAIISIVSSRSRPPLSTSSSTSSVQSPPVVYPDGSTSSTPASSTSSSRSPPVVYPDGSTSSAPSSSTSPSHSPPVVYPDGSTFSAVASSTPSSSRTSSSSTVASSSSSAVINPPFYTSEPQPCPQGNNSVYIDAAGFAYTIYCSLDSLPASYGATLYLDFASCIQRCDFDSECGAVAHLGENSCYLKPTPQSYYPGGSDLKLAVRLSGTPPIYPFSSTASTSARASSSSSIEVPQQYESTFSSSAGQSTTSSSSSSSSMMVSWSSTQVPEQYQGPTTTTITTSSSSSSSSMSTSSDIPDMYEQMTTSSSPTSSSTAELPDEYEQTVTTTTTSSTPFPIATTTTTTTSSSSSSPSSSAASSTVPYSSYLVLPSPTPCDFGDPPDYDEDDSYCEIDLPFNIELFGVQSQRTFAASNGFVALNRGSSQWQVRQFPNSALPELTVAPFYDDLYLYGRKQPRQGLYYQIDGSKVTYEWYVGRATTTEADKPRLSQSIYHFTMEYDSATPNTFVYTYYAVGSAARDDGGVNGAFAAVGLQGKIADGTVRATTYSFRNAQITPGSQVRCTLSQSVNECVKVTNPLIVVGLPGLGG